MYLMFSSFRFCICLCVCVCQRAAVDVGDTQAEHPITKRTDARREHLDVEETALGRERP